MDYFVNSFYILYKRWIPAGDPKDEAVLVTSVLIWLNLMAISRFALYYFFRIHGSLGWIFASLFGVIYFIMYHIYTRKKRIDLVVKRNPLFGNNVYVSMFVLALSLAMTGWVFMNAIFYVIHESLGL
jgi:hypothetical protein